MGVLYYRIPGEKIIHKTGETIASSIEEIESGDFFITSFDKTETFVFKEKDGKAFHFSNEEVYSVSEEEYKNNLAHFISSFGSRDIQKAIYSRVKNIERPVGFDMVKAFETLCESYPQAFVYLISTEYTGTWLGATPETLISGEAGEYYTMSLAGTKKDALTSWTNKEIKEQAFVTDFILENLESSGIEDVKVNGPNDLFTGAVYHLKTDIGFATTIEKVKELVKVLHPTPAVCGVPTKEAMKLIKESESHDRKFYAGVIGRMDDDGCKLFVNLRCMQILKDVLCIYVGGGITKDSDINSEFLETENKAQTLLKVLFNK